MNGKLHKNKVSSNSSLRKSTLFIISITIFCFACEETSVYNAPAKTKEGINAIIEIPAGTNKKIEFNKTTNQFEVDQVDGMDRIVNFLPYPGNYGFIPSTYMSPEQGGDGDPLDVLIISESQPTGTNMSIKPIGALMLLDDDEIDTKIIAVPSDTALQVIAINDFKDLLIDFGVAKRMIEDWFLTYKGMGNTQLIGWKDEKEALEEIQKWMVD